MPREREYNAVFAAVLPAVLSLTRFAAAGLQSAAAAARGQNNSTHAGEFSPGHHQNPIFEPQTPSYLSAAPRWVSHPAVRHIVLTRSKIVTFNAGCSYSGTEQTLRYHVMAIALLGVCAVVVSQHKTCFFTINCCSCSHHTSSTATTNITIFTRFFRTAFRRSAFLLRSSILP